MSIQHILSVDLGATKCAAGLIAYQPETKRYECLQTCQVFLSDTSSLLDMIRQIEAHLGLSFRSVDAICVGAAGQYDGRMLNHLDGVYPYPMNFAEIAEIEQWPQYVIIHDYDSVLCATFTSYMYEETNLLRLNQCTPDRFQRRVAVGLGTGLGMKDGVLLQNGSFWIGNSEIGHIGIPFPPFAKPERLKQHQAFIESLQEYQRRSGKQITLEHALTGRGLVHLYQFLYPHTKAPAPEDISEKMRSHQTPELLDLFAWYCGLLVGTLELSYMPTGGIWLTGGVVIKNLELFNQPSFHEGIVASPAYQREREVIPLGVMINPQHALIGAAFYAVNKLIKTTCLS